MSNMLLMVSIMGRMKKLQCSKMLAAYPDQYFVAASLLLRSSLAAPGMQEFGSQDP